MIAMSFWTFLVLLGAGVVAAAVVHYVIRYRLLEGFDGFLAKVIAGWVGAWLGSPIIGHWFERVKIASVYLIPALVGAFVGSFVVAVTAKGMAKVFAPKVVSGTEVPQIKKDLAA